mgnify:CR=1 FL=1
MKKKPFENLSIRIRFILMIMLELICVSLISWIVMDVLHISAVPNIVWIILAVLFVGGAIAAIAVVLHARHEQKEEEERILRRQKRLARLEASGISQEEFDLMLERKRSSYTTTKKGKRTLSRKRK